MVGLVVRWARRNPRSSLRMTLKGLSSGYPEELDTVNTWQVYGGQHPIGVGLNRAGTGKEHASLNCMHAKVCGRG